jgi:hypothetical protein
MDPATIALILAGLQTASGIAGMFRKKPKYPAYQGYSPELKSRILGQIKERIGDQSRGTLGTLESGAIRRGFGRSGQMGQIARDVAIAGDKDYANAVTDLERAEVDRYQQYLLGKYGAQSADYAAGGEAAAGAAGSGISQLIQLLAGLNTGGGSGSGSGMLGFKPKYFTQYGQKG